MKSFIFILLYILCFQVTYASDIGNEHCLPDQSYKLSIFTKNDSKFVSKNCELSPDNQYVENFLISKNKKISINKINGRVGNGAGVTLKAVSLYKKPSKAPILITLFSETYCCYPQPSGKLYTVELFEISGNDKNIQLKSITHILGNDSSGLDGVSDDYMHFKLKNIASIKKWLDKNYK